MRVDEIKRLVEGYVVNARWWPWKGVRKELEVKDIECTDNLVFLLLSTNNSIFQLPLLSVPRIPESAVSRGFCTNSQCFVEAEFTEAYLSEFVKLKYAKYWPVTKRLEDIRVYSAKPLTTESTNAVSLYETNQGLMVLKSYRLLSPVNVEVKVLERLTSKKYRYVPNVCGFLYKGEYASGVLMEYVKGVADGGTPFYAELVDILRGVKRRVDAGLSAKLGVIIGEMHVALNADPVDEFFGAEPVLEKDVSRWSRRVERMYSTGLRRLDEIASSDPGARSELEYWRGLGEVASRVVDQAVSLIEKTARNLFKARIHQDLHLAQMIYTGDGVVDFVITDFEGEPGRTSEERLEKEPVLRDIASMIRSFHYLSHAALMNAYNLSRNEASLRMLKADPTTKWRKTHVLAMTYSYLARVYNKGILGVMPHVLHNIGLYLYPWVVERAVYEFYYESLYRPGWVSIPIVGILESRSLVEKLGRITG